MSKEGLIVREPGSFLTLSKLSTLITSTSYLQSPDVSVVMGRIGLDLEFSWDEETPDGPSKLWKNAATDKGAPIYGQIMQTTAARQGPHHGTQIPFRRIATDTALDKFLEHLETTRSYKKPGLCIPVPSTHGDQADLFVEQIYGQDHRAHFLDYSSALIERCTMGVDVVNTELINDGRIHVRAMSKQDRDRILQDFQSYRNLGLEPVVMCYRNFKRARKSVSHPLSLFSVILIDV